MTMFQGCPQRKSVGSVLKIADSDEYATVWNDQAPPAFGTDLAILRTDYASVNKLSTQAISAKGGSGNAKAAAELTIENATFISARALANHFKKTGDLDNLGKVNYTKSAIVKLRNQDLIEKANMIRDIGLSVKDQQGAIEQGIPTVTATLTEKIAVFSAVMNLPRGEIVSHATLLKEVSQLQNSSFLLRQAQQTLFKSLISLKCNCTLSLSKGIVQEFCNYLRCPPISQIFWSNCICLMIL